MPTDEEIKARLRECADSDPWDGWQHVITQLRKGRVYYRVDGLSVMQACPATGLGTCGFLDSSPLKSLVTRPRQRRPRKPK